MTFTDATICLNDWTDVSENSIYGFIILKEDKEYIIDMNCLSSNTLSKLEQIKIKLKKHISLTKKDKSKPKSILVPEPFEENVGLFFDENQDKNQDENQDENQDKENYNDQNEDEINKQIDIISINNEEKSIMKEFFNFETFKRDQKWLIIEIGDYLIVQQNDVESEE
ncbi:17494_t:CDS:2 [Cetraspora pellucida]|uniref:17494_t:CDS:1 n=1 Tax=Cetraspora pellucida TaxID=1433469 RepID=A0ACA9M7K3_9GLOM|nr:17494_t:CDS:2 [Cetraspora pellucida]